MKLLVKGTNLNLEMPCVNLFIDTTDYGHAICTSYDLAIQDILKNKRITDVQRLKIYEKRLTEEYYEAHKDSGNINFAIYQENRRVNALKALCNELSILVEMGVAEPITAYIPKSLLDEIVKTSYKEFMYEPEKTDFYSDEELEIWREEFVPLMQEIGHRVIFCDIESCKIEKKKRYNRYNNYNTKEEKTIEVTQERLDKLNIYLSLHKVMVEVFKEEQKLRASGQEFDTGIDNMDEPEDDEDLSMPF